MVVVVVFKLEAYHQFPEDMEGIKAKYLHPEPL